MISNRQRSAIPGSDNGNNFRFDLKAADYACKALIKLPKLDTKEHGRRSNAIDNKIQVIPHLRTQSITCLNSSLFSRLHQCSKLAKNTLDYMQLLSSDRMLKHSLLVSATTEQCNT